MTGPYQAVCGVLAMLAVVAVSAVIAWWMQRRDEAREGRGTIYQQLVRRGAPKLPPGWAYQVPESGDLIGTVIRVAVVDDTGETRGTGEALMATPNLDSIAQAAHRAHDDWRGRALMAQVVGSHAAPKETP